MPRHQEDVFDQMESLAPARMRNEVYAAAAVFGMIQNDIAAETATVQRCPKCNHHSFRRLRVEEKESAAASNWRCTRCGNETDEFGNVL